MTQDEKETELLRDLFASEGWKIWREVLANDIEALKEEMLYAEGDNWKEYRGRIFALRQVLGFELMVKNDSI